MQDLRSFCADIKVVQIQVKAEHEDKKRTCLWCDLNSPQWRSQENEIGGKFIFPSCPSSQKCLDRDELI